jgi:penicillin-binding protein 1A
LMSYRIPDGAIVSMVGGYDYNITKSEFNRAVQAVRQPGSTFKPILFSAAIDAGMTPSTIVVDSPLVYRNSDEQTQLESVWRPDNYDRKFYGDMTLRSALALSRNIPAIKLLQHLKIPTVIEYAKKLGIQSKLAEDLSIALGSSGMTLEELMKAWAIFGNEGRRLTPYFIRKVVDRDGNILEEYKQPDVEQVIPQSTAFLMTSLLKSVVEFGTGTPVKPLGRPVAGKTGTTSDYKDALFLGYVPELITGVWVGFDEDRPLGRNELGGRAAAPIWLQYMQVATVNLEEKDWDPPATIQQAQIDAATGDVPTYRTKKRFAEFFAKGNTPGLPKGTYTETGELIVETNAPIAKTLVVTGNPGMVPGEASDSSPESDVNTDSLLQDEF